MRGSFFFFFSFFFIFIFSFFRVFLMFFLSGAALGSPGLHQNIAFYSENFAFKARIWVREEERKKRKEKKRKEKKRKEKKRKEKKRKERKKERRTRRQKQVSLPQSHAQDLLVIRVGGNPSLRCSRPAHKRFQDRQIIGDTSALHVPQLCLSSTGFSRVLFMTPAILKI